MKVEVTIRFLLLAASLILTSTVYSLPAQGQPRQLPVYEVWRAPSPMKVDGRVDEPAWARTRSVGPFVRDRDAAPVPYENEAKVLYDDKFLYFSFRSVDENVWATMRRRDQHLWDEEVVEVFLQADPRQPSYIELEVNPLGTLLDIYLHDAANHCPTRAGTARTCVGPCGSRERLTGRRVTAVGRARLLCRSKTS